MTYWAQQVQFFNGTCEQWIHIQAVIRESLQYLPAVPALSCQAASVTKLSVSVGNRQQCQNSIYKMSSFKMELYRCFLHTYKDRANAFDVLLKISDSNDWLVYIFIFYYHFSSRTDFIFLNDLSKSRAVYFEWGAELDFLIILIHTDWNNKTARQKSQSYYTWNKKENGWRCESAEKDNLWPGCRGINY